MIDLFFEKFSIGVCFINLFDCFLSCEKIGLVSFVFMYLDVVGWCVFEGFRVDKFIFFIRQVRICLDIVSMFGSGVNIQFGMFIKVKVVEGQMMEDIVND